MRGTIGIKRGAARCHAQKRLVQPCGKRMGSHVVGHRVDTGHSSLPMPSPHFRIREDEKKAVVNAFGTCRAPKPAPNDPDRLLTPHQVVAREC